MLICGVGKINETEADICRSDGNSQGHFFACIAVSGAAFFLLAISPIDPLQSNVGQAALGAMSPEQIEKLRAYWGMDVPMLERFFTWVSDFIRGDMGTSLLYRRPVAEIIREKAVSSLGMMAAAWLISGVLGFFLGIWAGMNRGKWQDKAVTGYSLFYGQYYRPFSWPFCS